MFGIFDVWPLALSRIYLAAICVAELEVAIRKDSSILVLPDRREHRRHSRGVCTC